FAPEEKSCAGQIYRFMERNYGIQWPTHFGPLIESVDRGDSATWPTVEAALTLTDPINRLSIILDHAYDESSTDYVRHKQRAIEAITTNKLDEFLNNPLFK